MSFICGAKIISSQWNEIAILKYFQQKYFPLFCGQLQVRWPVQLQVYQGPKHVTENCYVYHDAVHNI